MFDSLRSFFGQFSKTGEKSEVVLKSNSLEGLESAEMNDVAQESGKASEDSRRQLLGLGAIGAIGTLIAGSHSEAATWKTVLTSASGATPKVQVFTSSGSWTAPAGVTTAWVTAIGGGGGGSNYNNGTSNIAVGGGSGDICFKKAVTVVPATVYTVTIGSGGAAGAGGSATSFGALVSLAGGGAASGGTVGSGGGTFGNGGTNTGFIGIGGTGPFGGGAKSAAPANSGAGGGGTSLGGAGGSGVLIVEWFA